MGAIENNVLNVSLRMDDSMHANLRRAEGALEEAKAYEISDGQMAELANSELRAIITRKKEVEQWRRGFVQPAKDIIANAEALFDPALQKLAAAESHLKALLSDWTEKESARVEAERRAAEEAARKAQAEADAKAAAERARAEEQARKAREEAAAAERVRAEAEERARQAREAGDKEAAAAAERQAQAAAAERAKKEEEERERVASAEARASQIQMAAAAAPVAKAVVAAVPKGFGTRDNWVAEIEPGKSEQDVICAIAAGLANRPELIGLLKFDASAANKMAKALKGNTNIPCVKAVNRPVATSRAA